MLNVTQSVSVLLCVRNGEKYISDCLKSILAQTFTQFELIIVDDNSNDNTRAIIEKFQVRRIRYYKNKEWLGITKSRNRSIKLSQGNYLFFTDGDCVVSRDWIEQGLKSLKCSNCAGVEGITYYVSEDYVPTFSDHTYPRGQGKFMTGNIAYKKNFVERVGGFDERYSYFEDRDLAFRILRFKNIEFNPKMTVCIQKENVTPKQLVKHSPIIKNRVYLFKRFKDKELISWRIVDLWNFEKILCPPSLIMSLFINKFKTAEDYNLLPFTYIRAIQERLQLWRECARERIFLI